MRYYALFSNDKCLTVDSLFLTPHEFDANAFATATTQRNRQIIRQKFWFHHVGVFLDSLSISTIESSSNSLLGAFFNRSVFHSLLGISKHIVETQYLMDAVWRNTVKNCESYSFRDRFFLRDYPVCSDHAPARKTHLGSTIRPQLPNLLENQTDCWTGSKIDEKSILMRRSLA